MLLAVFVALARFTSAAAFHEQPPALNNPIANEDPINHRRRYFLAAYARLRPAVPEEVREAFEACVRANLPIEHRYLLGHADCAALSAWLLRNATPEQALVISDQTPGVMRANAIVSLLQMVPTNPHDGSLELDHFNLVFFQSMGGNHAQHRADIVATLPELFIRLLQQDGLSKAHLDAVLTHPLSQSLCDLLPQNQALANLLRNAPRDKVLAFYDATFFFGRPLAISEETRRAFDLDSRLQGLDFARAYDDALLISLLDSGLELQAPLALLKRVVARSRLNQQLLKLLIGHHGWVDIARYLKIMKLLVPVYRNDFRALIRWDDHLVFAASEFIPTKYLATLQLFLAEEEISALFDELGRRREQPRVDQVQADAQPNILPPAHNILPPADIILPPAHIILPPQHLGVAPPPPIQQFGMGQQVFPQIGQPFMFPLPPVFAPLPNPQPLVQAVQPPIQMVNPNPHQPQPRAPRANPPRGRPLRVRINLRAPVNRADWFVPDHNQNIDSLDDFNFVSSTN